MTTLLTLPESGRGAATDNRAVKDNRAFLVYDTPQRCARCGWLFGLVGYGKDRNRPVGYGCYATRRTCRDWVGK